MKRFLVDPAQGCFVAAIKLVLARVDRRNQHI
jgi:hypothetical protein